MSDIDFKSLLDIEARQRKAIETQMLDDEWAQFGRTVHGNLVGERFVTALQVALLAGGPTKAVARRVTAFLLTGTITK
jgi:hypothetical protein